MNLFYPLTISLYLSATPKYFFRRKSRKLCRYKCGSAASVFSLRVYGKPDAYRGKVFTANLNITASLFYVF